jgi:hypothetical protein
VNCTVSQALVGPSLPLSLTVSRHVLCEPEAIVKHIDVVWEPLDTLHGVLHGVLFVNLGPDHIWRKRKEERDEEEG